MVSHARTAVYATTFGLTIFVSVKVLSLDETVTKVQKIICVVWGFFFCLQIKKLLFNLFLTEMSEELVLRFTGSDYIDYVVKETFKRDHLMKEILNEKVENSKDQRTISIRFKTKHDGVLMSIRGQRGSITLQVGLKSIYIFIHHVLYKVQTFFLLLIQITDRKPVYIFKDLLSGHVSDFAVDTPVADGVWHLLSLLSTGQNSFFSVDGEPVLNFTGQRMDLSPVTVEKIIIGAAPTGTTVQPGKGVQESSNTPTV